MKIPNFKDSEITKFLVEWDRELGRMEKRAISSVSGNRSLLLYSPNKSVYELTVSDAGALVITKVSSG